VKTPRAIGFVCALLLLVSTGTASEKFGKALEPKLLAKSQSDELRAAIEKAREERPEAFQAVETLITRLPELNARSRGRTASLYFFFESMGSDALLPALELLVFGAPDKSPFKEELWPQVQGQLIANLGYLRDPRAYPVLVAILESELVDQMALNATVTSLSRLETDEVVEYLIGILDDPQQSEAKKNAVRSGVGFCRRAAVAERLAQELLTQPDQATARVLLKSLGHIGNYAAWTDEAAHKSEEAAAKQIVEEAAFWAYTRYENTEVRREARVAIIKLCSPATLALVEDAKKQASPELMEALERLADQWQRFTESARCR
jgi:hypothetical protein